MADKKAVIKNADMSEDMQQDAVDCATQALEKYNIEKDIAAFIKKEFDKKYDQPMYCSPHAFSGTTQHGTVLLVGTLALM
jgi:dynein light chain LC8-type